MSDLTDRIASDVPQVFLRTSDFATEADYTFGSVVRPRISVLFDENFDALTAFGVEVPTTGPYAVAALSDVLNDDGDLPDSSATLEIDGTTYHVTKPIKAAEMCVMILSRDEAAIDA